MEFPQVTVVTITYNLIDAGREKYVRKMIESVKNQTYSNVEHLIIDGASTDGTLEIFKDYPHLRVFSEPDKGIYDAFNKGVQKASGKYIAFLNSDDFWHDPKAIESSVELLENNNADYSYAPCTYLDENDKLMGFLYPSIETFFVRMPFSHQTMFTRTNLVNFDTKYKSSADYDFILRLILSGAKGIYNPLNFTSYRYIGFSSGIDDSYGNEGCKIGDAECLDSLYHNLVKRYGISNKDYNNIWYNYRFKRSLLDSIIKDIDNSLAEQIQRKFLNNNNNDFSVYYLAHQVKLKKIIFNARALVDSDKEIAKASEAILDKLYENPEYEVELFAEADVIKLLYYNKIKLYKGSMEGVDAFVSPYYPTPDYIIKTNVPVYDVVTPDFEMSFDYHPFINPCPINSAINHRIGPIIWLRERNKKGCTYFKFLKIFPILKVKFTKSKKEYFLFNLIKIFERRT